ncbi:MAG: ABC transporter permease, partial [Chloroflexota bacterium]
RWPRPGQGTQAIARSRSLQGLLGFVLFFGTWYLTTAVLRLPHFDKIPNPLTVFLQWISLKPVFGLSIFTPNYYRDILTSTYRVYVAFALATVLGVGLGLMMGWSATFRNLTFPVVEVVRPIPPLSWVPLAVLVLPGNELPVIYVTFVAAFFATVLNTWLGVQSIDQAYFRAAQCLGFSRWDVFRQVVLPGALPYVFTGLQISMGLAWIALVAGEMIAGRTGLGYLIFDGFSLVQYPNIIIGMMTLGALGYLSSAMVRFAGRRLMAWQTRGDW